MAAFLPSFVSLPPPLFFFVFFIKSIVPVIVSIHSLIVIMQQLLFSQDYFNTRTDILFFSYSKGKRMRTSFPIVISFNGPSLLEVSLAFPS